MTHKSREHIKFLIGGARCTSIDQTKTCSHHSPSTIIGLGRRCDETTNKGCLCNPAEPHCECKMSSSKPFFAGFEVLVDILVILQHAKWLSEAGITYNIECEI